MVGESKERQRHTASSAFRLALESARRSAAARAGPARHFPRPLARPTPLSARPPSEALLRSQDHITLWRMSLLMPGSQSEA
jgi:hypothetical protein